MSLLFRGSTGDNVRLVQGVLTEAGLYAGSVDGIFGSQTERAVRQWQGHLGLQQTGQWDPNTSLASAKFLDEFSTGSPVIPSVGRDNGNA